VALVRNELGYRLMSGDAARSVGSADRYRLDPPGRAAVATA
jgi:hypothetical protein